MNLELELWIGTDRDFMLITRGSFCRHSFHSDFIHTWQIARDSLRQRMNEIGQASKRVDDGDSNSWIDTIEFAELN